MNETPQPVDSGPFHLPLMTAVLKAQGRIDSAPKSSRNEFSAYDYTSAETMIALARGALLAEGVLVSVVAWAVEGLVLKLSILVAGHGGWMLSNLQWPIVEGKGKPLDKAVASALTSALREYLRVLLLIPRGTEDMDAREDKTEAPAYIAIPPLRAAVKAAVTPDISAMLVQANTNRDPNALARVKALIAALPKPEQMKFKDQYVAAQAACAGLKADLTYEPGAEG